MSNTIPENVPKNVLKNERCQKCKNSPMVVQQDRKYCMICGHSVWIGK